MAKGVSIKFTSYKDTVPKILKLIKLELELQKHGKIVLKPFILDENTPHTPVEFVEAVLEFCIANKKSETEILIAEGSDGQDTFDLFNKFGYKQLAEKYSVGLVDLNNTDSQQVSDGEFLKFQNIMYPKVLSDAFIISMPKLSLNEEMEMIASLPNMIGAFPSQYYRGLFSKGKSKIRKHPLKYAIHDILRCKMPNLAVIDASDKGSIIAGQPIEMDKQAAKVLGLDWKNIQYLRLVSESFLDIPLKKQE